MFPESRDECLTRGKPNKLWRWQVKHCTAALAYAVPKLLALLGKVSQHGPTNALILSWTRSWPQRAAPPALSSLCCAGCSSLMFCSCKNCDCASGCCRTGLCPLPPQCRRHPRPEDVPWDPEHLPPFPSLSSAAFTLSQKSLEIRPRRKTDRPIPSERPGMRAWGRGTYLSLYGCLGGEHGVFSRLL